MTKMLAIDKAVSILQAAGVPAQVTNLFRRNANTAVYGLPAGITPATVLRASFVWSATPEGHAYWSNLDDTLAAREANHDAV